jgi:putative peptide modification system cyclase
VAANPIIDTVVESRADVAPRLRTLLLTDLCNSTELVEKLGDARSAELFQAHDRLVLELQRRWRARLIDRSDGLLLLFERAVDGLGFALDYVRGLRELGKEHGVELQARAGLHVGEVLTWQNSTEAVSLGAKPLEVEGLAKPMAARLMALARPGQVLVSAVAEPLAHRAARELGPRGEQLLWKSWGRWCFKGVPGAQEIFEVGEAGIAPLRVPRNGPKAWRDIPLWRRPAALVAEAALLAGLAVGTWFATRPQPAIAFAERDWVVVGDLHNLTGDKRYDDALETALRISLEQSRYVNVMPDARVQDTLKLMGSAAAQTKIDRDVGSEVAQRSGARALLLPTVANVGGRVRVSIEVVDPATQATVYAESAAGSGADSSVKSVGEAATALRGRLGEALASIQSSSAPVEQVTTPKLDALRAFTLGQEAYAVQDLPAAEQQFQQALAIDPGFAMARIGLARVAFAKTDAAGALQQMQLALRDNGRLSDRERLYAQASLAQFRWERGFIDKWVALAKLYPDFHVASFNAANGMYYGNRFAEMLQYSDRAAAQQAITRPAALMYRAIAEEALGNMRSAERDFRLSSEVGFHGGFVQPTLNAAVRREFSKTEDLLRNGPPQEAIEREAAAITIDADAGRWDEAAVRARTLLAKLQKPQQPFDWVGRSVVLAILQRTAPAKEVQAQAKSLLEASEHALPGSVGRAREAIANAALYAGYVAAGHGDAALVARALKITGPVIESAPQRGLANMAALAQARLSLTQGKAQAAVDVLQPYKGEDALLLTRLVRNQALEALHQAPESLDRDSMQWRGRAYAEWASEHPPVIETLVAR